MKKPFSKFQALIPAALAAAALWTLAGPAAAQQGVSKDEILVGTIQDLSGPLAGYGKQARNGLQLRVDEINEQGGIHGRKIKLLVEDSGYDPKKAVLAAQKLVNQDKIFIMAGHIGTAQNNAAMPVQFEKNIVNFMPLTAAREMFEPLNRLKYAMLSTYYDQMRIAVPRMVKEKNAKKVCAIYQDDEFGLEVLRGAEAGMKAAGADLVEKTSFKRGATDFSSQVARMKAAGCDLVVMAEDAKIGYMPARVWGCPTTAMWVYRLGVERAKRVEGAFTTLYAEPDIEVRDGIANLYVRIGALRIARAQTTATAPQVLSDLAPATGSGSSKTVMGDRVIDISDAWIAQMASTGSVSLLGGPAPSPVKSLLASSARRLLVDDVVWLHADHLRSTIGATDTAGALRAEQSFFPLGGTRASTGYVDAYGFTGGEHVNAEDGWGDL